jgi:hypothetical protein
MILFKRIPLLFLLVSVAYTQNHVLQLDGVNDYVNLPAPIVDGPNFTIQAWVYLAGAGGGIEEQNPIFEQRTDATGCNHSAVSYFAESHSYEQVHRFGLRGDTECTGLVQHYTPAYESWHHYTVVQEGAYSRLYLDGLLVAMLMYEHSGSYSNNISYVSLGQAKHDGASYGSLNGMMDEVRIWDIALSSDEIEATMYSPLQGNENGLVAYWDFENSTTQALDQSNNGNDGTFMNGASIAAAEYYVPEQLWGDLNEDGHVNISDVILLINHILGAND